MLLIRSLSFLVLLCSCASFEYRHSLIDQILVPTTLNTPLLCNHALDPGQKEMSYSCLDLRRGEDRELLWRLKFVCKIGKKMYGIDKERPGIVRNEFHKEDRIFGKDKIINKEEFLDVNSNYAFFLASSMKCFSIERYSFDLI